MNFITRDIRTHKLDYSLLAVFATVFTAYFILSRHSPSKLFFSSIVFAILYIFWGIWHHSRKHHLNIKIMLEYFLVATLGIVIVSTLLI